MSTEIPGPRGRMAEVLTEARRRDPAINDAIMQHLLGGTSADWLAQTLSSHGLLVGATTLKAYRRQIREAGV